MLIKIIMGPAGNWVILEKTIPKIQLKIPKAAATNAYWRIFELIILEAAAGTITKAPTNKEPTTFTPNATINEIAKR